jgi:hypothetical protein
MKLINEINEHKEEERHHDGKENDFNFEDKSFDERENAQMINTNMGVQRRF